jgi:phage shock protein A
MSGDHDHEHETEELRQKIEGLETKMRQLEAVIRNAKVKNSSVICQEAN